MEKCTIRMLSKYRLPIMGFATLWIMMNHVWKPILTEREHLAWIENYIKEIGFCGVDIFLLVSGLGLVFAIEKYDLKTFYLRRFIHVYPAFFFAGAGIAFFRGWGLEGFLRNVLLINFFTKNIYSYLWYVPAILLFYLFFPVYYKIFKQAKNKYIFVSASIVVWYVATMLLDGILREDFFGITNRIPIFIVGILVGWMIEHQEIKFNFWHWGGSVFLLILGGVLAYLTTFKDMYVLVPVSNCCLPNFFMSISLCFLLANGFGVLENFGSIIGKGIVMVFSFFGKLSLPLYCIQEYLNTDFMKNPPTDKAEILNILVFIYILCAGIGLYIFCKPIENFCLKKSK